MHTKIKIGNTYGRLTVIELAERKLRPGGKGIYPVFKCRCSCGKIAYIMSCSFRRTKSCGCLREEVLSRGNNALRKLRLPGNEASQNAVYGYYRISAFRRGLKFNISREELLHFTKQPCTYCGRPPSALFKKHKHVYRYTGLDRIDNQKGYEMENIVPCCGPCNRMKGILTQEKFIQQVQDIARHLDTNHVCNNRCNDQTTT